MFIAAVEGAARRAQHGSANIRRAWQLPRTILVRLRTAVGVALTLFRSTSPMQPVRIGYRPIAVGETVI